MFIVRTFPRFVAAALLVLFSAVGAQAQRCIIVLPPYPIPPPRPQPVKSELRLQSLKITVDINDGIAKTISDQTFRNDLPYQVEATYLFPLPVDAVVSEFSMYIDGRKMSGEVLDKDKARSIYESIVRQLRDPGLLEYMGQGLFKASLFPVHANAEQRVQLEYHQHLPAENGMYRYEYPLSRPGATDGPESLVLNGAVTSTAGIKTLYSPTHIIDTGREGESKATFSLETKAVEGRQNFVLYCGISDQDFGAHLVSSKKNGEDGYFLLTLSPKSNWQRKEISAKDIIFVLDTSGSMAGEKIKQAKNVLTFCLDNLNPDDRFGLVTFSTEVRSLDGKLLPANEDHLKRARSFVDDTRARGGTDIHSALREAMRLVEAGARPSIVLFVTDGLPTGGETDETAIAQAVRSSNKGKDTGSLARLFTFGVGYDVNTHLLDRLADENQGVSDYVKPEEEMEVRISGFFEKIIYPVLSDLEIDWGNIKVHDLYPRSIPDLFKGSQVTVLGRYANAVRSDIILTGLAQDKKRNYRFSVQTPDENKANQAIPRLWVARKVGFLLNEIRLKGDDKELKDEVVRLSLEFGIVTPFTSMLVQEDARRDRALARSDYSSGLGSIFGSGAPSADGRQGGGGVSGSMGPAGEAGPAAPQKARAAFESKSGRESVDASTSLQAMKQQTQLWTGDDAQDQSHLVQQVGSRTFYRIGDVWTDSSPQSKVQVRMRVKFLSDAYFQLALRDADVAKFLALGERVVISFPRVVLEIAGTGQESLSPQDITLIFGRR